MELWAGSSRPGHSYPMPGLQALGQSAAQMGSTRGGRRGRTNPWEESGPLGKGVVPKPYRAGRKRNISTPTPSAGRAQWTAYKTRTEGTPRPTKAPVPVVLPGPEYLGTEVPAACGPTDWSKEEDRRARGTLDWGSVLERGCFQELDWTSSSTATTLSRRYTWIRRRGVRPTTSAQGRVRPGH